MQLEGNQLNWMRNALNATGLGIALIHFRREIDNRPPLGGLVLCAMGLTYSYVGSALYLRAAWQMRRTLGLSTAAGATLVCHAFLAPAALTTAAMCFADRTPRWVASVAEQTFPGSSRQMQRREGLPTFLEPTAEAVPPKRDGEKAARKWWWPW